MKDEFSKTADPSMPPAPGSEPPALVSRRMLIRGASVAVPAILTLNSKTAAAMAAASGTIGVVRPDGGDALCLLGDSPAEPGPKPGVYYLPDNPYLVEISGSFEYRYKPRHGGGGFEEGKTAEQLCLEGGRNVSYRPIGQNGRFEKGTRDFGPGLLVSNAAAASFGVVGSIPYDL